jgi:EAL domain-containing protein (putative c-di-GMP-specific phosphodiesterase class I)
VFIPLAEKYGLIDPLTEGVFDDAASWLVSAFPQSELTMAINISARSLDDLHLADRLAAQCERTAIDPRRIILEVTETGAMADAAATTSLATRLRLKGFRLSIDDFGVGYSSLVQLARLPFSELKIDTSFTQGLAQNKESRKIVKAIIDLGRSLGLEVTAEGVQDRETLNMIREMNCDLAQGYFVGRPMTRDAVVEWMEQRASPTREAAVPGKRP